MGVRIGKEKINRQKGFLYPLGKEGKVIAVPTKYNKTGKRSVVGTELIKREKGFLYYVDKEGYVAKAAMKHFGRK
jgi:hypothetical protein